MTVQPDPHPGRTRPPPAELETSGLTYSYPDGTPALRGIDLRVRSGERVAILGPNGAGKTTLMLHLNGLLRPDSGTVAVGGTIVASKSMPQVRRLVGLMFQDPDDQLFMPTVAKDVAFGPANAGVTGDRLRQVVTESLVQVGMLAERDRAPHHLSLGQRRRVALATVLACEPEILVLDEPSSNLDPTSRRELAELLLRLDRTFVIVTHDLAYAAQVCRRAVILDAGRVVADAPVHELLRDEALLSRHRLELPYGFELPGPTA